MNKNEFHALPWHSVVLLTDSDRNNFAQTLSGLREVGFILSGQIFIKTEYKNGLPVKDVMCQLLVKKGESELSPMAGPLGEKLRPG